ncbi:Putative membrane spanning protein (plasmid) [Borrelia hermsii YBT]|uniref:virulence associated lipoprotein n=1 Tax=Borrelia hermsii TaxID=140 RepID=UPI0003E36E37|nr:virulence associated lipoprotein [Borrelia hermsii]AHH13047.1 Putative membrane spanning protein [Borrelia hermsii YBT]
MQNFFIITFLLSLLVLVACNSGTDQTNNKGGTPLTEEMYKAELEKQKIEYALMELNLRATIAQKTLDIHSDKNWSEDPAQFKMHDATNNNAAFDILKKDTKAYNHDDNKNLRRKFYLALEYHTDSITSFGLILNKLAEGAVEQPPNPQYKLLETIVDKVTALSTNYFETAFIPLTNKKDKLNSLSIDDLESLQAHFRDLDDKRQIIRQNADAIQNKFKNPQGNIGQQAQLIKHIDDNKNEFIEPFAAIEQIAKEIKSILDTI